MIFPRSPRLRYFKSASNIEDFSKLKILDFGGNRGNLLEDGIECNEICQSDYTCIDVDPQPIAFGRERFPEATWIHYNSINWKYNNRGNPKTVPLDSDSFDLVCAYSVHSHATFEMFLRDLAELYRVCKPGGKIITTILTTNMMQWFMHKRKMNYNVSPEISIFAFDDVVDYTYYIDDKIITKEWSQECIEFFAVYNEKWLLDNIPYTANIITNVLQNTRDRYQPALIIQKTA